MTAALPAPIVNAMGMVVSPSRRELFVDPRGSALRVSWHHEHGMAVLSIWHGDVCVGTSRLDALDASRLAQFLVGHLGAIAAGDHTT